MQDTDTQTLIDLFQTGDHGLLQQQARSLLATDPGRGVVWKVYAASLSTRGAWLEALPAARKAAELLPQDAEALSNLGFVLFQNSQAEEAEGLCRRALSLEPKLAAAWVHLGIILRHQGRLTEALECQLKALELTPHSVQVHGNLGNLCKELGHFEPSINHFRQALILQFNHLRQQPAAALRSVKPAPGRSAMPKAEAYRALDELRACLESSDTPWCLIAGTLLGVHRDGDLLPNDKDMDIGVPAEVGRERLESVLCDEGRFELIPQLSIEPASRNRHSMSFLHLETGVTVDAFFMHPEEAGHFLMGLDHPGMPMLARVRRFTLGTATWRGRLWPVPSPLEAYLEDIYGPGWVRPDPGFDTVLSNPSRIPEAMPATLCYGYSCLNSRLLERNWPKSRAYCRQLLARIQDPLLRDLAAWLAQLEEAP